MTVDELLRYARSVLTQARALADAKQRQEETEGHGAIWRVNVESALLKEMVERASENVQRASQRVEREQLDDTERSRLAAAKEELEAAVEYANGVLGGGADVGASSWFWTNRREIALGAISVAVLLALLSALIAGWSELGQLRSRVQSIEVAVTDAVADARGHSRMASESARRAELAHEAAREMIYNRPTPIAWGRVYNGENASEWEKGLQVGATSVRRANGEGSMDFTVGTRIPQEGRHFVTIVTTPREYTAKTVGAPSGNLNFSFLVELRANGDFPIEQGYFDFVVLEFPLQ